MTFSNCELLALSIKDLMKMKLEFPYDFIELFSNVKDRLNRELVIKLEIIRRAELQEMKKQAEKGSNMNNKIKSMVTFNVVAGL